MVLLSLQCPSKPKLRGGAPSWSSLSFEIFQTPQYWHTENQEKARTNASVILKFPLGASQALAKDSQGDPEEQFPLTVVPFGYLV